MANTYVIYYGWLAGDATGTPTAPAREIAEARPDLLIAHHWAIGPEGRHVNLSPAVLELMEAAGTRVYAYVATTNGAADAETLKGDIDEYLRAGVAGIFFDEADPLIGEDKLDYYGALAQHVRAAGKAVIVNPGVARCGEALMEVADKVMVEHQWRELAGESPWMRGYPPARFMGVSSNEGCAMRYFVDERRALKDTREALQRRGIGWHTSTGRYIDLPPWFARYVRKVKALRPRVLRRL
jgi:hypothetical protein